MDLKKMKFFPKLITYLLLILGSIVFLAPIVWMISTSLKGEGDIFTIPPKWIPEVFQWSNYVDAVNSFPFFRYTVNSVIITAASVIGGVISSAFVAYAFAKLRWPGRDIWFIILIATMMLPPQITMVPLFIFYSKLDWINTYLPLILPHFFGSAFYIFLIRQFYKSVPKELDEAAKIDGASAFYIWSRIYIPLSKPVLATTAIFIFMFTWNDFLGPLIYLMDSDKFTLQLGLRGFQQQYGTRWNVMMAASVLVALPTIVVFFAFQKYFIRGAAVSGVKG